jgi:hypothetical protein
MTTANRTQTQKFRLAAASLLVAALAALTPHAAFAGCLTPNGIAGDIIYNGTYNVLQYCNGTNWIDAGSLNASGGALTSGDFCTTNGTLINCTYPFTGTGNVVLSASPTLTGTVAGATSTWTGSVAIGTTTTIGALNVNGTVTATAFSGSGSGLSSLSVPIAAINASGTPGSTTYLRGDGSWATVSSGGSGTVTSSTAGQVAYFQSSGATVIGTSTITISGGQVGIGTTSPSANTETDIESSPPTLTGTVTYNGEFVNLAPTVGTTPTGVTTFTGISGQAASPSGTNSSSKAIYVNGVAGSATYQWGGSDPARGTAITGGNFTATMASATYIGGRSPPYIGTIEGVSGTANVTMGETPFAWGGSFNAESNGGTISNGIGVNAEATNNSASATIGNASGVNVLISNAGTILNAYGIQVGNFFNTGTMTAAAGIASAVGTAATSNTELLLGTTTIPTGNFSIYDTDTTNSYFAGNVGIGTTAPAYQVEIQGASAAMGVTRFGNTPTLELTGSGGTQASPTAMVSTGGLGAVQFLGYDGSSFGGLGAQIFASSTETWVSGHHGGQLDFYTTPNGARNSVDAMTIANTGYVGIGTAVPLDTLDVYGTGIHIASGTPASTSNALYNNSGTLMWNGSSVGGGTPGGSSTQVQFNSGGTAFGGDSGFTYAGSGAVTITGAAATALSVTTSNASGLAIWGNTSGSGIGVRGDSGSGNAVKGESTSGNGVFGQSTTGSGVYGMSGGGDGGYFTSSTGYALITGTGNVGIGTTGPLSTLDVAGAIYARSYNDGSSASVDWSKSNVVYTTASCGAFTFTNMQDGGSYTLIVQGATAGTCSFSQSGLTFKSPQTLTSTVSTQTVFTFLRAGSNVYVSMIAGF